MFYDPVRLRTLARFLASDPWSGHHLTEYTVDDFVMMPLGSKRALHSKWSLHATGIQWQNDARFRLLPESLVDLWKTGKVPAEELPCLLHSLEPALIETDFIPAQSWQRSIGIPMLVLLLICPIVFFAVRVNGGTMPATAALAAMFVIALGTGLTLWVLRINKRSRAKEQTTWALTRFAQSQPQPGRPE